MEYSGVIRLADRPYKIIRWFTMNWDKEIGAMGVGKVKDGEILVEKLVFPKQTVNSVHVHFKPEDWAPILTELSDEEQHNIIFYWHKHPDNSPGSSQGDEDDTFGVFMGPESEKKVFGFAQTAKKGDSMIYEARIELRKPLWVSIKNVKLVTKEEDEIEKECRKIIKDKVTEGWAGAKDQPGAHGHAVITTTVVKNKETTNGVVDDGIFDCEVRNGAVYVFADIVLKDYLDERIGNDMDIDELCSYKYTSIRGNIVEYRMQPKKGKLNDLVSVIEAIEDEIYAGGFEDIIKEQKELKKETGIEGKALDLYSAEEKLKYWADKTGYDAYGTAYSRRGGWGWD